MKPTRRKLWNKLIKLMADIEDEKVTDVNIENIGYKKQKNTQPGDILHSEKYEFMIDGYLFKIELKEDNLR